MITLFFSAAILELLLYVRPWWSSRQYVQFLVLIYSTASTVMVALVVPGGLAVGLVFLGIYRLLNLVRLIANRSHDEYLRVHARRASLILISLQVLALLATDIQLRFFPLLDTDRLLLLMGLAQLATATLVLRTVMRSVRKMDTSTMPAASDDTSWPTVSVAIPARNETPSLQACIESVLANDYPKLEILVLDDCSQDKTSEIIKGYAQAGVRFIKGREPEEKWLAKNQAYQQLFEHATGEVIIFCGVDVRLEPATIRHMVTAMNQKNKQMLAVLPRHRHTSLKESLVQPMRYWWELALPRRFFNRPAVLSTCWAIRYEALKKLGGFKAVSRAVIPEGYFARELVTTDGYSFVRTGGELSVTVEKDFTDQYDRAIRYRYPEVHRRLELVAVLTLAEIGLLLGPFVLVPWALLTGQGLLAIVAFAAVVELIVASCLILAISSHLRLLPAIINFPIMVLTELAVGNLSLIKYEFMTVDWKGRNICLPVMHSESRQFVSADRDSSARRQRRRHRRHKRRGAHETYSSGESERGMADNSRQQGIREHDRTEQQQDRRQYWHRRQHRRRVSRHHRRNRQERRRYHEWYR